MNHNTNKEGSGKVGGKRILVVDDDEGILTLLRDALSTAVYEVDTAFSAASALELIRNNIYAVAVVDYDLPDMNGVMLHREIRQKDRDLAQRTIFMSGHVEAQSHQDYYDSEGTAFVSKPIDVWALIATIHTLTGQEPAN
jgi:DNA-binding response OmpR family regulator